MKTPNDNFLNIWQDLEQAMRKRLSKVRRAPDVDRLKADELVEALYKERIVDYATWAALGDLRRMRNGLEHPKSGDTGRKLFSVTEEGLEVAQNILQHLKNPPTASEILRDAETCSPDDMVTDVLARMRSNDFDMIPYQEDGEWKVFSRTHVALWVESAAEDPGSSDATHIMLERLTVSGLAAKTGVAMAPVTLSAITPLHKAVEKLESAIRAHVADAAAGPAPMLLSNEGGKAKVATPWDLPKAAELMKPVRARG